MLFKSQFEVLSNSQLFSIVTLVLLHIITLHISIVRNQGWINLCCFDFLTEYNFLRLFTNIWIETNFPSKVLSLIFWTSFSFLADTFIFCGLQRTNMCNQSIIWYDFCFFTSPWECSTNPLRARHYRTL